MTTTATLAGAVEPALLDVHASARLLGCSWRHVRRMGDSGRMPAPVRLGAAVRWRRSDLIQWIANGCPPVRRPGRGLARP
jgi:excisionase family DNA binding protein